MASSEVDRLRVLAQFADQICSMADNGDEARRRIHHLVARAEQDIKTKTLEIQLQQSHIALLKHLEGFLSRPLDVPGPIRLNDTGSPGRKAIAGDSA